MLGVDNHIVRSDNIDKLSKSIKDVNLNEKEDSSNEKNVEVRQKVRNDIFDFGGRKNFTGEQFLVH